MGGYNTTDTKPWEGIMLEVEHSSEKRVKHQLVGGLPPGVIFSGIICDPEEEEDMGTDSEAIAARYMEVNGQVDTDVSSIEMVYLIDLVTGRLTSYPSGYMIENFKEYDGTLVLTPVV